MATRVSSEFLINSTTDFFEGQPDVGVDAQGNSVVVWSGFDLTDNAPADQGIFFRRFDSSGDDIDNNDVVVDFTTDGGRQSNAKVGVAASGRFVVVWEDDGDLENRIAARLYEADGDPDGSEFSVTSDSTTGFNLSPDVSINTGTGQFVVTWVELFDSNGDRNLFAQRFTADGDEDGDVITVATIEDNDLEDGQTLSDPAIAMDAAGNFIISWTQDTQEDEDNGADIFAKRYDASGNIVNDTFVVNTQQENRQFNPDVATDSAGNFFIVWDSFLIENVGTDLNAGVYGRRYDNSGTPLGDAFAIAAPDLEDGTANDPAIAIDASGNALVTWTNLDTDEPDDGFDIFARQYDNAGNGDVPIRVNDEETAGTQSQSAVTVTTGGDAVVTWRGVPTTTNDDFSIDQEIFGQQLTLAETVSGGNTGGNTGGGDEEVDPDATVFGTNGNDFITGNSDSELISVLNGDDIVFGKQGDDQIFGGNGNDQLSGGGGADTISGGKGADEIEGNGGNDVIFGDQSRDVIEGRAGDDILNGGRGRDRVFGNSGADLIFGDVGRDFLVGGAGDDCLHGGAGKDILRGGGGTNILNGGKGDDQLIGGKDASDTFAILTRNGFDVIRGFDVARDKLGFVSLGTGFNADYVRVARGTVIKINGNRIALVKGVDLSVNVTVLGLVTAMTPGQIACDPSLDET